MTLEILTTETFKEKVFNWEVNKEAWKYEGHKPCIVDFYADWCQPCKMLSPILENLQEEYGDNLDIFKLNVEEEPELANIFGIQSIPSILFIPMNEQPQMAVGSLPKETLIEAITTVLKVAK